MLRSNRLSVITGVAALAIAILGLAATIAGPASADPSSSGTTTSPVQKDASSNGLTVPHLGL